ncbi:DEAD/DEAH box helicase [Exiguobacterium flavidum]|uniref:DEAD/DEAH box helicase n=1 Tax=Exiguobacterium flavidum TaxID=2184695 RepID=UPI0018E53984|nr:SNF2-related protein [Exiguobacterium flavidum]
MNYALNHKKIKDICGLVAFRRGKRTFEKRGVHFKEQEPDGALAEITGEHDFLVRVKIDRKGFVQASCTCPQLGSFQLFCSHVAATLIAMHDVQVNGRRREVFPSPVTRSPRDDDFAREFLRLLPIRSAGLSFHFDATESGFLLEVKAVRLPEVIERLTVAGKLHISVKTMERFLAARPTLEQSGVVVISEAVDLRLIKEPFIGRIYLDRQGRLEVRLAFAYGRIVVRPGETSRYIGRDRTSEQAMIGYLKESGFRQVADRFILEDAEREFDFLTSMLDDRIRFGRYAELHVTEAIRGTLVTDQAIDIKVEIDDRLDWLVFDFAMTGIPEIEIKGVLESLRQRKVYHRLRDGRLLPLAKFNDASALLRRLRGVDEQNGGKIRTAALPNLHLTDRLKDKDIFDALVQMKDLSLERNPLVRELLPYQEQGVAWMLRLSEIGAGGILADEMGLGKTVQAIAYLASEEAGETSCVVAPASLIYNWESELKAFAPRLSVLIVVGNREQRLKAIARAKDYDVILTSYTMMRSDISYYPPLKNVIFDEAQQFKNPDTQTARALRKLRAKHRFALTGTPIENKLMDLWAIFQVVSPGFLPDRLAFQELSRTTVARLVEPFVLRRVKQDVLAELPRKSSVVLRSELLPEQKKVYAAYLAKLQLETLRHLDETKPQDRIKLLAGMTRLRQICCHPALFVEGYEGGSAKLDQLKELVRDRVASGRRILIFSQFTRMLGLISESLLQVADHVYLSGETPIEERIGLCERFNAGEVPVFLISLKAGGVGLNLTGADTVILYDLWWNPAVEDQASSRAHRMGQTREVEVVRMIASGTIEEKIDELQRDKERLIREVIDFDRDDFIFSDWVGLLR